jgi:hypothetical protein
MHAEITIDGDSFSSGQPQSLLVNLRVGEPSPSYLVSNDGERFLYISSPIDVQNTGADQNRTEFVVVENWFEELKRLAPPFQQ